MLPIQALEKRDANLEARLAELELALGLSSQADSRLLPLNTAATLPK